MTNELATMTIAEIQQKLAKGETTSCELTQAYLARIEALEPKIQAFLTVLKDEALQQAEAADVMRQEGARGPLLGVPLGIKDNMCIEGTPTTCASKILQ